VQGGEEGKNFTTDSLKPNLEAMWDKLGQKNSDAQIPTNANKNTNQIAIKPNKKGLFVGVDCLYSFNQSIKASVCGSCSDGGWGRWLL